MPTHDNQTMSVEEFRERYITPQTVSMVRSTQMPVSAAEASRVDGGKRAQAAGAAFENGLDTLHARYAAQGYARIIRLPVPTVPAPRNAVNPYYKGPPLCMRAQRQLADYVGTLASGVHSLCPKYYGDDAPQRLVGRTVFMEAKATQEKTKWMPIAIPGDKSRFGIKAHQLDGLSEMWRTCRAPGVVLWNNGGTLFLLLPHHVTRYAAAIGTDKKIPAADFVQVKHEHGWIGVLVEWLYHQEAKQ